MEKRIDLKPSCSVVELEGEKVVPEVSSGGLEGDLLQEKLEFEQSLDVLTKVLIFLFVIVIIVFLVFDWVVGVFVLVLYVGVFFGRKWIYIYAKTYKRDLLALNRFIKVRRTFRNRQRLQPIPKQFQDHVEKNPNKIAFHCGDHSMTFNDVNLLSNQIANYYKTLGYRNGDSIALFMETSPEYVCFWLGLSKIGVVSALINTNLRNEPLVHSIKSANCKAVIYGTELRDAITAIRNKEMKPFDDYFQYYEFDQKDPEDKDGYSLKVEILKSSKNDLDLSSLNGSDKLMYIFTSGTTGLPKPAIITHTRYTMIGTAPSLMAALTASDVLYCALPIYHSAGGIIGTGHVTLLGGTLVLRKKFSASNFWKDCIKYQCTVAQYIGEVCRYLLASTPSPEDSNHPVQKMLGNGLKPQIWKQFITRFKVSKIYELYGSTEGNANLFNVDCKVGAVGFMPFYGERIHPVGLVKCDVITGEILRNEKGLCIPAKAYEPGVVIGKIDPQRSKLNAFNGYADQKETDKKLVRDVYSKGDTYFNSGDILIKDYYGYIYFKDRTGDTFRWKGENVATSEIEGVISNVIGLNDAIVYGVQVPNNEGRAGMVSILDPNHSLDVDQLGIKLDQQLPKYAKPVFLRIMDSVPMTGTYKLQKRDLQVEGYDITKIKDPIYVLENNKYELLTNRRYNDILFGLIKF